MNECMMMHVFGWVYSVLELLYIIFINFKELKYIFYLLFCELDVGISHLKKYFHNKI